MAWVFPLVSWRASDGGVLLFLLDRVLFFRLLVLCLSWQGLLAKAKAAWVADAPKRDVLLAHMASSARTDIVLSESVERATL